MKKNLTFFVILLFVITSTPLFSQWVELNTGVTARLNSVSSIKEVTTWACGVNGTVIKSSNSGDNWQNGNLDGIGPAIILNHIYALSTETVFAAGNDQSRTYLYRTINGGSTWHIILEQTAGKFNAIHFIDQSTGILVGDPVGARWSIWKTTNGGNSWDSAGMYLAQNNSEKGFNNSMWAMGNDLWFGTDNFRIYRSFNFGNSWNALNTGAEKNSASLWFDFDFNIGLSGNQNMIKTINSGNSWFVESVPGSGNVTGVTGSAHSRFNWATKEDKIYVNPHNENIWRYDYTSPAGNYTYITIERNGYFGGAVFAARDNGGISRTYFLPLGVNIISGNIPKEFGIHQNYPNPFNPLTKIGFEIAQFGMVNITVFDALGRKIETIVNQELKPGVYEAEWNGSNYTSGIY
ncbi:MAG: hypothetical protein ACHQIH_04420, partial [Ignavibacteria bacterium]